MYKDTNVQGEPQWWIFLWIFSWILPHCTLCVQRVLEEEKRVFWQLHGKAQTECKFFEYKKSKMMNAGMLMDVEQQTGWFVKCRRKIQLYFSRFTWGHQWVAFLSNRWMKIGVHIAWIGNIIHYYCTTRNETSKQQKKVNIATCRNNFHSPPPVRGRAVNESLSNWGWDGTKVQAQLTVWNLFMEKMKNFTFLSEVSLSITLTCSSCG